MQCQAARGLRLQTGQLFLKLNQLIQERVEPSELPVSAQERLGVGVPGFGPQQQRQKRAEASPGGVRDDSPKADEIHIWSG